VCVTKQLPSGEPTDYGAFAGGPVVQAAPNHAAAQGVYDAGFAGRNASEYPDVDGTDRAVDGAAGTHVLIWARKPNTRDRSQIADIAADCRRRSIPSTGRWKLPARPALGRERRTLRP
jgi:hypothetical protein